MNKELANEIAINERRQILDRIDDYKQLTNNFSAAGWDTVMLNKVPMREIKFNRLSAKELVIVFEMIIKTHK